jgi:hypothetical protein
LIVSGVSVSGELQFLNPTDDMWVHAGVLTGRIGGESPVVLTSDSMVTLSFNVLNDTMSGSAELPDIDDTVMTDLVASRS